MENKLKELELLAKNIVDLSTEDDDMISQENLFKLQIDANDLYHQIKDLRKKEEKKSV